MTALTSYVVGLELVLSGSEQVPVLMAPAGTHSLYAGQKTSVVGVHVSGEPGQAPHWLVSAQYVPPQDDGVIS